MVSESINPLPSDRLRCCDRYIRCQRSLAVKPLTMSGSPSHRGSVRRVSRSQVTHVPISNCSCSMCAMTVSRLMSTCGNYSCASNGGFLNGRVRRLGPFSTAGARRLRAFVHYRSKARLWLVIIIIQRSMARVAEVAANPHAKQLYTDLLVNNGYNKLIRPVGNNSDKLTVKLGLRLSQLIDVVRATSLSLM